MKGKPYKIGANGVSKASVMVDEILETSLTRTAFLGINCMGGTGHLMKNKGKKKKRRK